MKSPIKDTSQVSALREHPTPEERAHFVILRLEQFIRDGRTIDEGMSLKKWQAMACTEIAVAIAEVENSRDYDEINSRRILFVAAAAMVTIGFWGAVVSFHHIGHLAAGIICAGAGAVLLFVTGHWRLCKWNNRRNSRERAKRLNRIENLNKRIKRLETELAKEEEALEDELRKRKFLRSL